MTFLLDVNALLALGFRAHVHHWRVKSWLEVQRATSATSVRLATCAITELGFVRVAAGAASLAASVRMALAELRALQGTDLFTFFADRLGAERLPAWVQKPAHTTDGHLLALAHENGARLATLDRRIPGADLIPAEFPSPWRVQEADTPYGCAV